MTTQEILDMLEDLELSAMNLEARIREIRKALEQAL